VVVPYQGETPFYPEDTDSTGRAQSNPSRPAVVTKRPVLCGPYPAQDFSSLTKQRKYVKRTLGCFQCVFLRLSFPSPPFTQICHVAGDQDVRTTHPPPPPSAASSGSQGKSGRITPDVPLEESHRVPKLCITHSGALWGSPVNLRGCRGFEFRHPLA